MTQLIHSGEEQEHRRGVALVLDKKLSRSLVSWQAISSRILTARLLHKKQDRIELDARSNWVGYLCVGNNSRIILYNNFVNSKHNASKQNGSACKQMLSHEDHGRCASSWRSIDFTKISSLSPTFNCSEIVILRRSFTWTNVVTRTDDLLRQSTVRWRSSDCQQLHFEPGSTLLYYSLPLAIVWSISICRSIFKDFTEVLFHYRWLYQLSP